jgi:hypothetical protein
MAEQNPDLQKTIAEFNTIRRALLVPFAADLRSLPEGELPRDRRWQIRCVGNRSAVTYSPPPPDEKPKAEKA